MTIVKNAFDYEIQSNVTENDVLKGIRAQVHLFN